MSVTSVIAETHPTGASPENEAFADPTAFVRTAPDGVATLHCLVEGVHCAGCVRRIESALKAFPAVIGARVNLTTRRLVLSWRAEEAAPTALVQAVVRLGFKVAPYDPETLRSATVEEEGRLLRALAVAGFATANVMLLSVSVWAGAFQDMGPATRDLLHWISALIALPAVAYAGWPFFRSAAAALKGGGLNMDVPISLGVILASAMSLFETMTGGAHAYFDAAVSLLFFLLIGRYLDLRARAKARSAAEHLVGLQTRAATLIDDKGRQVSIPASAIAPGMTLLVAPGERIPADGRVLSGRSDVDMSLVSGETVPQAVAADALLFAGAQNLTGALTLGVTASGEDTLLAEIIRLMEAAEQGRARYVRLADRLARAYAPVVHILGATTFAGWMLLADIGWQASLLIAVSTLIVTCPCALGLAVPVVQVVASGRLYKRGILLKSPDALERLARVDHVVFDKTGTLTLGQPELLADPGRDAEDFRLAAAMASASRHPLSRALARGFGSCALPSPGELRETPGAGLSLRTSAGEMRLGSAAWCGVAASEGGDGPELWLARPGRPPARFRFRDILRPEATATVAWLKDRGFGVELLSGDREGAVERIAREAGIEEWRAVMTPAEKTRRLEALAKSGKRVLMVGDGLNDAPALAAAFVSLSPSTAADVSQTAADAVFQGDALTPVKEALTVARRSDRLIKENFALAFLYNAVAVPLAVLGYVTPLLAAIAMSASSIAVSLNSQRLRRRAP